MTFFDDVKTILEAGTWTNYGSCPSIREEEVRSSKRASKWLENFVLITKGKQMAINTLNGTKIKEKQSGVIICISKINETNRDNIEKDVIAILEADADNIVVESAERIDPERGHFTIIKVRRIK